MNHAFLCIEQNNKIMKKSILIAVLSIVVIFSGLAQTNGLKGPAYKNAKVSEKYDGNSTLLIKVNPRQFQGPQYKNFNKNDYEIEIIDSNSDLQKPDSDLIVSSKNVIYTTDKGTEKIIYRRVHTKDMKGKNLKGLKGPAYKNYKR